MGFVWSDTVWVWTQSSKEAKERRFSSKRGADRPRWSLVPSSANVENGGAVAQKAGTQEVISLSGDCSRIAAERQRSKEGRELFPFISASSALLPLCGKSLWIGALVDLSNRPWRPDACYAEPNDPSSASQPTDARIATRALRAGSLQSMVRPYHCQSCATHGNSRLCIGSLCVEYRRHNTTQT